MFRRKVRTRSPFPARLIAPARLCSSAPVPLYSLRCSVNTAPILRAVRAAPRRAYEAPCGSRGSGAQLRRRTGATGCSSVEAPKIPSQPLVGTFLSNTVGDASAHGLSGRARGTEDNSGTQTPATSELAEGTSLARPTSVAAANGSLPVGELSSPSAHRSPAHSPSPSPLPPSSNGGVISRSAVNGLVRLLRR